MCSIYTLFSSPANNETGLRNDSQHERGYAPKGKTPVNRLNAKRVTANMISAVTNPGKVRFLVFDDTMITDILIDFCKRLIKSAGRKIVLLLDNLRVHHAMVFKPCIVKHADEIIESRRGFYYRISNGCT